jgi:hypothetical protein
LKEFPMMRTRRFLFAILLCLLPMSLVAGVPSEPVDLLRASFDDKPLGQPIGTGGASVGEPINVVRLDTEVTDCQGSRCLQVKNDLSDSDSRTIVWQLLDNAEVTTGIVSLRFTFTPSARDRYFFAVRESGSAARAFLSLRLFESGAVTATDSQGSIPLNSFTYAAEQTLDIQFDFDLDAGTSQASINDTVLFSGREHGVTDRGVGRLITGFDSSSGGSLFLIDDVIVLTEEALPLVLDADFDAEPVNQPLPPGNAANHRPVSINPAITADVLSAGAGNNALRLTLPAATGIAATVRWQFLDDIELLEGIVALETSVQFAARDHFSFSVREAATSSASFATVEFLGNGNIRISETGSGFVISPNAYSGGVRYRLRVTFDQVRGTYSVVLNDTPLVVGRPHGSTSGRGIGSLLMGFQSSASAGASMLVDDVQVGANAAAGIASELAILQQPANGRVGQPLAPTLEIGALNVFDQLVSGAIVSIDFASGPAGAALSQREASTVNGVASFPDLRASQPGDYRLRARADRASVTSAMVLSVQAVPVDIFSDGFEAR